MSLDNKAISTKLKRECLVQWRLKLKSELLIVASARYIEMQQGSVHAEQELS